MDDAPKEKSLLAALRGAIDRHVKQRPRDLIVRNAIEDPAEVLAQRVMEGDACEFCSQFANSGPVDPRKVSEKFHAYCKCHFMLFFQETKHRDRLVGDDALERAGITMESGADPDYYEKRDALILRALGKKVEFLKRHPSGARRADTLVDGELVEFKNPTGSGIYTVQRQIKSSLYGNNKEVMKPQSDVLLISNVRNSMTMSEMQESLAFAYGPDSLLTAKEKAAIRKIILMDERTRRVRVYEMKEPALHGSGPRRRQIDSNTSGRSIQGYTSSFTADDMAKYFEFHKDESIVGAAIEHSALFDENWNLVGKVISGSAHSVEFVIPDGVDPRKLHLSHVHTKGGTLSTRHLRRDGSESGDLYVFAKTKAISIDAQGNGVIYRITRGKNPDYDGLLNAGEQAEKRIADEELPKAIDEFFGRYGRPPISEQDFNELEDMLLPRVSERLHLWYSSNVNHLGFDYETIPVI